LQESELPPQLKAKAIAAEKRASLKREEVVVGIAPSM
jgi:hypothetical protein